MAQRRFLLSSQTVRTTSGHALDQGITELLDKLRCNLTESDGLKQNDPHVKCQCLSSSSLHEQGDTSPAGGLKTFYDPLHLC